MMARPPCAPPGEATREIGLAVMATTLSLVIIFLPLAYMPGIVGRFLKEYGLTVAFAIMVSLFVAFTLTPMLCSRFLKIQHGPKSRLQLWVDRLNDYLKEHYGRLVQWSMRRRWLMVAATVLTILSTGVIIRFVGKDFIPPDDAGEFQVTIKAPEGTSIKAMDRILEQIEAEVKRLPAVESLLASIGEGEGAGVNDGLVYVRWRPSEEDRSTSSWSWPWRARRWPSMKGCGSPSRRSRRSPGGGFQASDFNYVISGPDLDRCATTRPPSSKASRTRRASWTWTLPHLRQAGAQGAHRPGPGPGPRRQGRGHRQQPAHDGRRRGGHHQIQGGR
jgi:HAE1 family hydrophobic/amphiphilic exporter-1